MAIMRVERAFSESEIEKYARLDRKLETDSTDW